MLETLLKVLGVLSALTMVLSNTVLRSNFAGGGASRGKLAMRAALHCWGWFLGFESASFHNVPQSLWANDSASNNGDRRAAEVLPAPLGPAAATNN